MEDHAWSPFPSSLARGTARSCWEKDLRELGAEKACGGARPWRAVWKWHVIALILHYTNRGRSRCRSHHFQGCSSDLALCDINKPSCLPVGLQSGDNTLNTLCSLRAAQALVSSHVTDVSQPDARATVLSDYVRFLTTPASHSDTYAESCHRSFFSDWQHRRPTSPCEVKQTSPTERLLPLWFPLV